MQNISGRLGPYSIDDLRETWATGCGPFQGDLGHKVETISGRLEPLEKSCREDLGHTVGTMLGRLRQYNRGHFGETRALLGERFRGDFGDKVEAFREDLGHAVGTIAGRPGP